MMRYAHRTSFLCLSIVLNAIIAPSGTLLISASEDDGIYDWVRKEGGFYHEAQVFRTREDGMAGVFATEDIAQGTVLAHIPWDLIIPSDNPDEHGQLCCGLVHRLKRELELGTQSYFAPYIEYIKKMPQNLLPAAWSPAGQELIERITMNATSTTTTSSTNATTSTSTSNGESQPHTNTNMIPPERPLKWFDEVWKEDCQGGTADALTRQAISLILTRSDDHILIPGYDMYNHHNHHDVYTNADTAFVNGEYHETRATRDIVAGEQIFISYNQCNVCQNRLIFYGTGEMMRDYGFVEDFPQRFYYNTEHFYIQMDIVRRHSDEDDEKSIALEWDYPPPEDIYTRRLVVAYLRSQVQRLRRLFNIEYPQGNPGMPEHEWKTSRTFVAANIRAMLLALEDMGEDMYTTHNIANDDEYIYASHYDNFDQQGDDLAYQDETCDNEHLLLHLDHVMVESFETPNRQYGGFYIHPTTKDVLWNLNGSLRSASSFRSHQSELMVHAAARFIPSVRRVLFVGCSESMILHEILKYKDLELVVGIELDQTITRKAFRYFGTSPHFDDPRVVWWFGNMLDTVKALPVEYWHSFDLVIVGPFENADLMQGMDLIDAFALMVKPDGVMVKTDIFIEDMSQMFDYSMQICFETPIICDQVLTLGSQNVDFFHDFPLYDHPEVQTLAYTPLTNEKHRHDYLHDYRHSKGRSHEHCKMMSDLASSPGSSSSTSRSGVIEIIEAEQVKVSIDNALLDTLAQLVRDHHFHILQTQFTVDGNIVVAMKEGYILSHCIQDKHYCSVDIHLWSKTQKVESLSQALTNQVLNSRRNSSYRLVGTGMKSVVDSTSTWVDTVTFGGHLFACDNVSTGSNNTDDVSTIDDGSERGHFLLILNATRTSMQMSANASALVLCGPSGTVCSTYDSMMNEFSDNFDSIMRISLCENLTSETLESMLTCESLIRDDIKALSAGRTDLSLLVVDLSVSKEGLQILHSIFSDKQLRETMFQEQHYVIAQSDEESQLWRGAFLDRYRKQWEDDPIRRILLDLQHKSNHTLMTEWGLVIVGEKEIEVKLANLEKNLNLHCPKDWSSSIQMIHGGKYSKWNSQAPKESLQSDYETDSEKKHYFGQQVVGSYSVFRLEDIGGNGDIWLGHTFLRIAFTTALHTTGFRCSTPLIDVNEGIESGCLMICLNPLYGSASLVWDGMNTVDISYYNLEDTDEAFKFVRQFNAATNFRFNVISNEEMPRGMGGIINFRKDILTPEEARNFYENLSSNDEEEYAQEEYCSSLDDDSGFCLHESQLME